LPPADFAPNPLSGPSAALPEPTPSNRGDDDTTAERLVFAAAKRDDFRWTKRGRSHASICVSTDWFPVMGVQMRSTVVKRSVKINGHTTSVSLEDAFWNALKEIAGARKVSLSELATLIDAKREHANLSSAIRLFILDYFRILINPAAGAGNALPNVEASQKAKSA
jgi:predicted DNA-binding ribbon-helix-helix protein